MLKHLFASALVLILAVSFSSFILQSGSVQAASTDTITYLQTRILELQKQLAQLLLQLQAENSTSTSSSVATSTISTGDVSVSCQFTRNLSLDSQGSDVSYLKQFLFQKGYLASNTSNTFDSDTKSALKRYQSDNNILASGFFGPITRAKINSYSTSTTSCYDGVVSSALSTIPSVSTASAVNYFAKGSVNGYEDYCSSDCDSSDKTTDGSCLTKYYIDGDNNVQSQKVTCEMGCHNGACVKNACSSGTSSAVLSDATLLPSSGLGMAIGAGVSIPANGEQHYYFTLPIAASSYVSTFTTTRDWQGNINMFVSNVSQPSCQNLTSQTNIPPKSAPWYNLTTTSNESVLMSNSYAAGTTFYVTICNPNSTAASYGIYWSSK